MTHNKGIIKHVFETKILARNILKFIAYLNLLYRSYTVLTLKPFPVDSFCNNNILVVFTFSKVVFLVLFCGEHNVHTQCLWQVVLTKLMFNVEQNYTQ